MASKSTKKKAIAAAAAAAAAKSLATADEDSINFRPSPNFKHMKKYLKSKFEESNNKTKETQQVQEETKTQVEEKSAPVIQEKAKPPPPPPPPPPTVNPPLPPNPPPPDSPPVIKQEATDQEYAQYLAYAAAMGGDLPEYTKEMPQPVSKEQKAGATMCRNFVRGTCTKGSLCIFVHELILEQLPEVYTFCWKFQNSECNLPRCKFVHATVFEKEYFYRTGYLPPHTLAHLKVQADAPATETPVADQTVPQMQEMQQGYYTMDMSGAIQIVDANGMPMQMSDMSGMSMPMTNMSGMSMPMMDMSGASMQMTDMSGASMQMTDMSGMSMPMMDLSGGAMQMANMTGASMQMADMSGASMMTGDLSSYMLQNQQASVMQQHEMMQFADASLNQDWASAMASAGMDGGMYTQPEMTSEVPVAPKCNGCESSEFRYQFTKNKVENMIRANEELNQKTNQLNANTQRLNLVLMALFKPASMQGFSETSSLGEKDKALLNQVNYLVGSYTGMPVVNEDYTMQGAGYMDVNAMGYTNMMTQMQ